MVSSEVAPRKDWTPLLSWSRALSLLQPAVLSSAAATATTVTRRAVVFIFLLLPYRSGKIFWSPEGRTKTYGMSGPPAHPRFSEELHRLLSCFDLCRNQTD